MRDCPLSCELGSPQSVTCLRSAGSVRCEAGGKPRRRYGRTRILSSNLEFAILGPLSAWRGGDNLDLGAPQQRAVLAALLLAGGRQVSLESLVDAVWEDPPQAAARIVRTYVSQLRRALMTRGSREIITSSGNGYVLPRERVS